MAKVQGGCFSSYASGPLGDVLYFAMRGSKCRVYGRRNPFAPPRASQYRFRIVSRINQILNLCAVRRDEPATPTITKIVERSHGVL